MAYSSTKDNKVCFLTTVQLKKKKISNHKISKDFLNRDQKDITQTIWTEKTAVLKCMIKHCHIELFLSKEYKTK